MLAVYFFDGWTLKEIAASTGLHESSVQRRIKRTVKGIRKHVVRGLQRAGMGSQEIESCLEANSCDLSLDLHGLLLRDFARE